jgi:pilus assembly protein Flp/PilA
MNTLVRLFKDDEGATMVEYAIMIALIAIVSIGIITTLGQTVSGVFDTANNSVKNA